MAYSTIVRRSGGARIWRVDVDLVTGLRTLRATRTYSPEPVPPAMVEGWLESARWCGSSRNSQPWRFVVVTDHETKDRLAGLGADASHLVAAPVVIVLASVPGPYPFSTIFDMGRVAQSLLLAAHADGVGSCIAVFEPEDNIARARELLGIPDTKAVDLAIGFGFPAGGSGGRPAQAAAPHRAPPRMPLSEIVEHRALGPRT